MSEGKRYQLGTIGALSLSVVSSVSIVICNKALISTLGFTFGENLMDLIHQFFVKIVLIALLCPSHISFLPQPTVVLDVFVRAFFSESYFKHDSKELLLDACVNMKKLTKVERAS